MISAGKLRHIVSVLNQNGIDDGFGNKSWQESGRFRANVVEKSGSEVPDKSAGHIIYEIKCRYRPDINYTSRIRYQNKDLELTEPPINVRGLNRELIITCKEITRG